MTSPRRGIRRPRLNNPTSIQKPMLTDDEIRNRIGFKVPISEDMFNEKVKFLKERFPKVEIRTLITDDTPTLSLNASQKVKVVIFGPTRHGPQVEYLMLSSARPPKTDNSTPPTLTPTFRAWVAPISIPCRSTRAPKK